MYKRQAEIIENSPVTKIVTTDGEISGVISHDQKYMADIVILCAGAIETPRLLRTAGLVAGEQLFVDTFVTVCGILQDINFHKEVAMNALYKGDGSVSYTHLDVYKRQVNTHCRYSEKRIKALP